MSGAARWLEVSVAGDNGELVTQPRVLLVSVPYALKAGDSETLGGLPASAYLRNPNADGVNDSNDSYNSTDSTDSN